MHFFKTRISVGLLVSVGLLAAGIASAGLAAEQRFIAIGTGSISGVYYPAGAAICRLMKKALKETGIRCSVESTGGSVYNINAVRSGELEFGIAQSDMQYHAFSGSSKFREQGRFQKQRAVFSIHPEPFTVVARKGTGIETFMSLKGKKVNVGNPGSGQRLTMEVVMEAFGIKMEDFAAAAELKGSEMTQALCDGKIDVMIYTIGHPAAEITDAATTCDVELIPVAGPVIELLIADNPYFRIATIPGGMYKGTDRDIMTFGVGATVITSADVAEDIVYTLVKSVFDNIDDFRKLHPALANLKEAEMIKDGLSAPLHDGAVKYYKERGWM